MRITVDDLRELTGRGRVVTEDGEKVGPIGEIYVDDLTGVPDWVTVRTGLFGSAETFVPLRTARVDGGDLVVAHGKDVIRAAPRIDADGALSPQEERLLYRHYGVTSMDQPERAASDDSAERSGPAGDAVVIRSEERLLVGTQERETGRARLRKHVVTEHVTETVAVRHEEARIIREPLTDAEREAATPGSAFTEETYEIVLHAETPVVDTTVVPVERVRLDTTVVTSQERVSADLRREEVELDDPSSKGRAPSASTGNPGAAKSASDRPESSPKGKKGTRRRH